MERNDAITTLEVLKANCLNHSRNYQALDYAISSLKTDEAYQIMYEGGEIFTKADMVAMLTEIQLELDEMKITKVRSAGFAPYSKDPFRRGVNCSKEIIQQKIKALEKI